MNKFFLPFMVQKATRKGDKLSLCITIYIRVKTWKSWLPLSAAGDQTMKQKTLPKWAWMSGAVAVLVVTAFAFSAADTGPRTISAAVVNDSAAYLELDANANSAYSDFVEEDGTTGKLSVDFGSFLDGGTGINPDSTYSFDALITVTNMGKEAIDVEASFDGADAALCEAALTSTETQESADYGATPGPLNLATTATGYLGLSISAEAKNQGDSVECTVTVTASS